MTNVKEILTLWRGGKRLLQKARKLEAEARQLRNQAARLTLPKLAFRYKISVGRLKHAERETLKQQKEDK